MPDRFPANQSYIPQSLSVIPDKSGRSQWAGERSQELQEFRSLKLLDMQWGILA
jgi:hypothetical protein